jgi:hypothetical protein
VHTTNIRPFITSFTPFPLCSGKVMVVPVVWGYHLLLLSWESFPFSYLCNRLPSQESTSRFERPDYHTPHK